MSDHPLIAELAKVQYDLTALKVRVSEIQRQIAALNLVESPRHACRCGLTFASSTKLAEHVYTSHDGPEPEHWRQAEGAAA